MARQSVAADRHRRSDLSLITRTKLALGAWWGKLRNSVVSAYRIAHTIPVVKYPFILLDGLTVLGWGALLVGTASLLLGMYFRWSEVLAAGAVAVVATLTALLWTIGRSGHNVELTLSRSRVTVGEQALGELVVSNPTKRALPSTRVELTVGAATAEFTAQRLNAEESFVEPFGINTQRRGLITVGPATTVRSDALSLVRRTHTWSHTEDLYIHPYTVPISTTATGLIRDIEGMTTQHLSSSDVSFHALRDYVPGDDRRSVHWKTTARTGKMMVRQFEETRRSHMLIVLDVDEDAWASEEEFEMGVSAAASLIRATMGESKEASIISQSGQLKTPTMVHALDSLSVVNTVTAAEHLPELTHKAGLDVPQASVAIVITGSLTSGKQIHTALSKLPLNLVIAALRIDKSQEMELRSIGGFNVATLPSLDDLSIALWKALG